MLTLPSKPKGSSQSRAGSGTYVLPPIDLPPLSKDPAASWPLWQQAFQHQEERSHRQPSLLLKSSPHPLPVDFSNGGGDPRLIPADDYRRLIQMVLRRDGQDALDYGEHRGYGPLRSTIAHILASQGIPALPDNVLVTAGSQQAIALAAQLLLKPGDTILVEDPTYAVALDLFRALNLNIIGIPMDSQGMQVDQLEKRLQQHHPRLLYTIPNFHNPTGTCLSTYRRRQLMALADRYNLPILEDDYVGDLRYEGRSLPALKSLDPGGRVIYASTFSKMLMPGLRVGFLVADGPVYDALVQYKHVNDLTTSNLHQRTLEAYVTVGRYQAHLRRTCQLYRKRRDAMLEAIDRCLPASVCVDSPQGGLFLWLRLPEEMSSEKLLPLAVEEGVAFAPGCRFYIDDLSQDACLRLNFASQPPDQIREGIQRLGRAIKRLALTH